MASTATLPGQCPFADASALGAPSTATAPSLLGLPPDVLRGPLWRHLGRLGRAGLRATCKDLLHLSDQAAWAVCGSLEPREIHCLHVHSPRVQALLRVLSRSHHVRSLCLTFSPEPRQGPGEAAAAGGAAGQVHEKEEQEQESGCRGCSRAAAWVSMGHTHSSHSSPSFLPSTTRLTAPPAAHRPSPSCLWSSRLGRVPEQLGSGAVAALLRQAGSASAGCLHHLHLAFDDVQMHWEPRLLQAVGSAFPRLASLQLCFGGVEAQLGGDPAAWEAAFAGLPHASLVHLGVEVTSLGASALLNHTAHYLPHLLKPKGEDAGLEIGGSSTSSSVSPFRGPDACSSHVSATQQAGHPCCLQPAAAAGSVAAAPALRSLQLKGRPALPYDAPTMRALGSSLAAAFGAAAAAQPAPAPLHPQPTRPHSHLTHTTHGHPLGRPHLPHLDIRGCLGSPGVPALLSALGPSLQSLAISRRAYRESSPSHGHWPGGPVSRFGHTTGPSTSSSAAARLAAHLRLVPGLKRLYIEGAHFRWLEGQGQDTGVGPGAGAGVLGRGASGSGSGALQEVMAVGKELRGLEHLQLSASLALGCVEDGCGAAAAAAATAAGAAQSDANGCSGAGSHGAVHGTSAVSARGSGAFNSQMFPRLKQVVLRCAGGVGVQEVGQLQALWGHGVWLHLRDT